MLHHLTGCVKLKMTQLELWNCLKHQHHSRFVHFPKCLHKKFTQQRLRHCIGEDLHARMFAIARLLRTIGESGIADKLEVYALMAASYLLILKYSFPWRIFKDMLNSKSVYLLHLCRPFVHNPFTQSPSLSSRKTKMKLIIPPPQKKITSSFRRVASAMRFAVDCGSALADDFS